MGNAAGLKAWQVLANAERALAIELLAGAQAVEFLAPLEPGRGVAAARAFVRDALAAAARGPLAVAPTSSASRTAIRDGSLVARRRGRGRGARVKRCSAGRRPGAAAAEASVPRQRARLRGAGRGRRASSPWLTGGSMRASAASIAASSSSSLATAWSWWRWRIREREARGAARRQ